MRDVLHYLKRGLYLSAGASAVALLYALLTQKPVTVELIAGANFYSSFGILLWVGIAGFTSSRGRAARASDHVILMSGGWDSKREHEDMKNESTRSARLFVTGLTPFLLGFLLYVIFIR